MLQRVSKTLVSGGGIALIDYLTARYTYHSRELWTELLAEGRVSINGEPAAAGRILEDGDEMQYFPRPVSEPPVDMNVELLFADSDYIAVNKPGNLPCHPSGCFFNNTLWALFKEGAFEGIPPMEQVRFVNRLDRETSGIVLVARSGKAAADAVKLLRRPESCKTYRVLVFGDFPVELEAAGWLYHDGAALVSKRRSFSYEKPDEMAEWCSTTFRRLEIRDGCSLIEARLHTGRTHQIRATLKSLGFPLLGDKIYGPDETIFLRFLEGRMTEDDHAALCMPRQALHAERLVFGKYDISAECPF